jgi:hypothetical protein
MPVSIKNRTAIHEKLRQQDMFEATDLNSMTKVKLLDFSETIGLELNSTLTKKKLVSAIESSSEFQSYERIRKWAV